MNRYFFASVFLSFLIAFAAPHARAEVDAESFKRLESDVSALTESRDSLLRQMQELREAIVQLRTENGRLRGEIALAGKDNASREELKKIVEQIQEVDRKRVGDGKLVRDKLEEIAKLASRPVVVPPMEDPKPPRNRSESSGSRKSQPEPQAKPEDDGPELPSEFYEHVVAEGETLGAIISAYNKDKGLKVRQVHVLKANPKLKDPRRIYVGMKLRIPAVK